MHRGSITVDEDTNHAKDAAGREGCDNDGGIRETGATERRRRSYMRVADSARTKPIGRKTKARESRIGHEDQGSGRKPGLSGSRMADAGTEVLGRRKA